jgi:cytochrome b pre-mRNA-processing protein 3
MILNLFRKSPVADAVLEAYRSIVAQSRQQRFYADWSVPDTVTGRFDMLSLQMTLVLRRLRTEPAAKPFTQALVDLFFQDMDRSHRELGVTDLGVPRKIRKLSEIFYGIVRSLGDALDSGSASAVEATLVRNVYLGAASPGASPLAAYLIAKAAQLETEPAAGIIAGHLAPDVAA